MNIYDVLFTLDPEQRFTGVEWGNAQAEQMYRPLFSEWTMRGEKLTDAFPLRRGEPAGEFSWDEDTFSYGLFEAPANGYYLLLKKRDDRQYLFAKALDHICEGVQIYDKNACAVYINDASRGISHIPSDVPIEGRYLLDMYALDETISTTMTCLRTQSPVINRVDHYKSSDGISIATANTSYPIHRGKELLGAVVFEQNSGIVKSYIQKLEEVERALKLYDTHATPIRFAGYNFDHIIGHGEKLLGAVSIAKKVAAQDSPVLLVGETGTGKEIFAQSIHRASRRRDKKFVAINCAAIPDALIESLLFGTQKGSFTGSTDKAGYFEEADGGTLFLDELNSMSLSMQSKILRAIQENTFRRVGGQKDIRMDVRIISSCNEDPFRSIADNQFRKDLFYRLSTVMIELPPLREHMEDLEELIRHHLESTAYQFVHAFETVDPGAMAILREYSWPGNVRELYHVLDYAQNVADSATLCPEHLPAYLLKAGEQAAGRTRSAGGAGSGYGGPEGGYGEAERGYGGPEGGYGEEERGYGGPGGRYGGAEREKAIFPGEDLQTLMDRYEHQIIMSALEHYGFNITKTAEVLGLRRQSLQYRIKKYGIII